LVRPIDVNGGFVLPVVFSTPDTVPEAPNSGSNMRSRPAGLGNQVKSLLPTVLATLPTPTVVEMGANKTVEEWDDWTAAMRERHGNGNGHGPSLSIEARRMLPTPTARDWKDGPETATRNVQVAHMDDTLPRALHHLMRSDLE